MEQNEDEAVQQDIKSENEEKGKIEEIGKNQQENDEKEENYQKEDENEDQKITNNLYLIKEAWLKLKEIEDNLEGVDLSKNKINLINEESKEYFELDGQLKEERENHEKKIKLIEEDTTALAKCFSISQQKCNVQRKELKKKENEILKNLREIEEKMFNSPSTPMRQTTQQLTIRPPAMLPTTPFLLQAINATIQQQFQQGLQQLQQQTSQHHNALNLQQQQQSLQNMQKLKKCQHCPSFIHRNAPTCPNCKQKIVSKTSKRVRKN
ncbi:unnamed protein product [Meloidogyne enterolobii]|uniref:Uncharacterized protein n=1 Tax=Meloidogyne enterolobii TaxID=390850 RepID=A0ACB1B0H4_MELEN